MPSTPTSSPNSRPLTPSGTGQTATVVSSPSTPSPSFITSSSTPPYGGTAAAATINNNSSQAFFLSNQPSSANSAVQQHTNNASLHLSPTGILANNSSLSVQGYFGGGGSTRASGASMGSTAAGYRSGGTRSSKVGGGTFKVLRSGGGGAQSPVGSTRQLPPRSRAGTSSGDVGEDSGNRPSIPRDGSGDYSATSDDDEDEEEEGSEEEFDRKAFREVASEINVNVNALMRKLQAAEDRGQKESMLRSKLRQNTRGGGAADEARVVDVAYLGAGGSSRPQGGSGLSPVTSSSKKGGSIFQGTGDEAAAQYHQQQQQRATIAGNNDDGDVTSINNNLISSSLLYNGVGGGSGLSNGSGGGGGMAAYRGDGNLSPHHDHDEEDYDEEDEEEEVYDEEDGYYFGDDDDEEEEGEGGGENAAPVGGQDRHISYLNNYNNNNSAATSTGSSGFYSSQGRGGHLYDLKGDAVVVDINNNNNHTNGSGTSTPQRYQRNGSNLTPTGNSPGGGGTGGLVRRTGSVISEKFRAAGGSSGSGGRHGSVVSDTNTEMGPPSQSTIGAEQSQSLLASHEDGVRGSGGRKRKSPKVPPARKGISFSKNEVSDVVVYEVGNELYVGVSYKRSWIGWAAAAAGLVCDTAFDVHMIYILYHIDGDVTAVQNWVAINRLFVSAIVVLLAFVLKAGMRPLRWVLSSVGLVALCLMSLCLGIGVLFEVVIIQVTGQAHFYVASVLYCVWLIAYRIIKKEMIFFAEVAATLVAVGGFMLSGFSTDISLSAFDASLGNVLALLSSLCYASYFVLIDRLRRRAPVVPMAAVQGIFAVLIGIPLALSFGNSGREAFGLFFSGTSFLHSLLVSIEGLAGNLLILASVKYLDVLTITAIYTLKSTIVPALAKLIVFNHLKDPPAFAQVKASWSVILGTVLAFIGTAVVVIFASYRRSFVSRRISTSKRKKVPNPYNRRARKEEKKRLKRAAEEKAATEAAMAAGAAIPTTSPSTNHHTGGFSSSYIQTAGGGGEGGSRRGSKHRL